MRYGGGWALVTGAQDGTGQQYALELALSGFNIILVDNNEVKMKQIELEIKSNSPLVETIQIVYDFESLKTDADIIAFQNIIKEQTEHLDVCILVNNYLAAKAATLDKHTHEDVIRMININVKAQTFLTHAMIPRFLKRESKSAIIDISSIRHMSPGGNVPVYSATKSYNYAFSRAMA